MTIAYYKIGKTWAVNVVDDDGETLFASEEVATLKEAKEVIKDFQEEWDISSDEVERY